MFLQQNGPAFKTIRIVLCCRDKMFLAHLQSLNWQRVKWLHYFLALNTVYPSDSNFCMVLMFLQIKHNYTDNQEN